MQAAPYKIHLRTTHANLDIVLASNIRHAPPLSPTNDTETDRFLRPEVNDENELEPPDSDYESNPDPTGCGTDALNDNDAHVSDAEVLNYNTSTTAGKQAYYPGAGEPIADVSGFEDEHTTLCQDPWAPFANAHDFKLASWFIQSKVS